MVNRLIIAAAGSGKTTYLVKQAMQQSDSVLITTYTIANELEIRKKFVKLNGCVPHNVTIQTWYSFLLQHGVRPFQGVVLDDKINGMILVNEKSGKKYDGKYGPVYYAETDYRKFYFTDGMKMYSDKIAKFVCRCEKETKGRVSQRISRIYSKIYVDEVQDLAGYDLDIIKSLLQADCDVTMVGDPRQVTYHTHNEAKYKKYADGKIEEFIRTECKKIECIIDKETLNDSYRNNQSICSYSSQLYEEYGETGTKQFEVTGHDGVFLVRPDDVDAYLEEFKPMQLREKRTVKVNEGYAVINMGESKGLTYDRVLIYPTGTMKNWIKNHSKKLQSKTKSQFEELWNQVHKKRQETGVANIKTHSLDHEHILSGIIKCPICGSGMYDNVNRKKHPDGGHYRDYFYYACKHRTFVNGHKCTYRKQWSEDKINAAVEEVIRKLVNNQKFKTEIQKHIGQSIDTQELDREHTGLQEQLKQVTGAKNKLENQMDTLSVSDKHYDKKYEDMQIRLDKLYDEMEGIETLIEEVETRLYNIRQEKISGDNVYQFLLFFDKLYDRFMDIEKKTFMKSFIADVNIYEEEQADGRILRSLKFRFPVFFNGKEIYELDWDNESTVETICLLSKKFPV